MAKKDARPAERARPGKLLAGNDFRWLLASQFLGQVGDGFMQAAFVTILILQPEGAPERILGVFALTLLPYSVIAPFLGVLVDRLPRRALLVATSVGRAVVVGLLTFIWGHGDPILYTSLLVLTGLGRLFLTTKGASLPSVLHEAHLLRGNSVSGGGGIIAVLAGGILGTATLNIFSETWAFALAGLFYVFSAISATLIADRMEHGQRVRETASQAAARTFREMIDGLRAIWTRERARICLGGIFVLRTIAVYVAITAVVIIKAEYGGNSGRLSASALALGAAGLGAFIGALVAPPLGRRFNEPKLILIGYVLSAAVILALGGIYQLAAVMGLMLIGGLAGFLTKVAVDAQMQEVLPDEYRGRGFAVYDILYNAASVAAAAALVLTEHISFRPLLLIVGLINLLAALVGAYLMQRAGMMQDAPAT
ncbi:MAG: MFS transporter [Actinobacteria bacterium]|nr:MFS transporter [Actinomycetota bacterium]